MRSKKPPELTNHELSIMQLFWAEGPLTVSEILERFSKIPKPAYTSVLTAVQGLERKGALGHVKEGKAYRYFPEIRESAYKKSAIKKFVSSVFHGSHGDLAVHLIKKEHLAPDEISRIKKLLEDL